MVVLNSLVDAQHVHPLLLAIGTNAGSTALATCCLGVQSNKFAPCAEGTQTKGKRDPCEGFLVGTALLPA